MRSRLFYGVILATALLLYGAAFFVVYDARVPGFLGLIALVPIVWASDALGLAGIIRDLPSSGPPHQRQYVALRSKVTLLLELVKRMNWLAVDMERGFRSPSEVQEELDQSVLRMKALVDEIRDAAGRTSDDPAAVVAPDLSAPPV